jgi:hypothetical protein
MPPDPMGDHDDGKTHEECMEEEDALKEWAPKG